MSDKTDRYPPFHHWKLRLFVAIVMVALSLLGLVIVEVKQDSAWDYWRFLSVFFAMISIGLHLFLKRTEEVSFFSTLWHEVFHWLGLLLSVGVLSVMVETGMLGRFVSSISVIMLLALSTYLAGVYMDISLVFVGLILGLFALGLTVVSAYLYPILIPVVLIGTAILWILLRKKHVHHQSNSEGI